MERQSSGTETSKAVTISNHVWKLKRYGRFIPKTKSKASGRDSAWKIFESCEKSGQLELNILGSGHLLVSQGQEVLEGFSLLNAQSFLKIQHKTDSLLFNITVKGENRLIRLQFDGSSRAEAAGFCSKAVEMLQIYVPVQEHTITPSSAATPASAALTNPAEPGTSEQQQKASEDAPQAAPAIAMGSLSIEHLSQVPLYCD
ncbi:meiotic recombination protein REC114-like [Xyrauchen texanus]|uniref:meiotic recombination protein REC114-like n=1 Tax=Xyrauchen texanus TaxID=154827 RepID=UPI002242C2B5|nr:meiotic recombination protein REC114-like [Xyrauchen texanus]